MKNVMIVKFGGSSIASPDLRKWVQAIEKSVCPLVVVPGGGPFAHAVRQFQTRIGYDAETTRRMTVLAIEQFGHALVSLGTRLRAASTVDEIRQAHADGVVPVWMPALLVLGTREIDIRTASSSDALAAWLASRIENSRLCLIKQIDLPADSSIEAISAAGVVDAAFPTLLHPATRVFVAGPHDLPLAGRRFAEGVMPGREVARETRVGAFVEAAQ